MTKKLDLGNCKLTFWEANGEAMFPAETEDFMEVIHVGGEILAEDENIIHLDEAEGQLTRTRSIMHERCSQHSRGQRASSEIQTSKGGDNSCLLNVLGGHRNLVIPFL